MVWPLKALYRREVPHFENDLAADGSSSQETVEHPAPVEISASSASRSGRNVSVRMLSGESSSITIEDEKNVQQVKQKIQNAFKLIEKFKIVASHSATIIESVDEIDNEVLIVIQNPQVTYQQTYFILCTSCFSQKG